MLKCDGCTVCCYLFKVDALGKGINTDCIHCDSGCKIHADRPDDCLGFDCAYLQMFKVSTDLRPDNCGMVFERLSERIFFGTQDPRREKTDIAKRQIAAFNEQGFSVIIVDKDKKIILPSAKHKADEIKKEFETILEKKYGRTKLHN